MSSDYYDRHRRRLFEQIILIISNDSGCSHFQILQIKDKGRNQKETQENSFSKAQLDYPPFP